MKIVGELYEVRTSGINKISIDDVNDTNIKAGLVIHKVDIVGKERQGLILSFKDENKLHKCNRQDVFAIAENYKLTDTDQFIGKKVYFAEIDGNVRIVFPKAKK